MISPDLLPEREPLLKWHRMKEGVLDDGVIIDATATLAHVADEILHRSGADR